MVDRVMTAAQVAEALACGPLKARNGNYLVCCPVHDDASPSLSLRDGDRGLMVHCFAGCRPADIYAAILRKDKKLLQPSDVPAEPYKGSAGYEGRQHDKAAWLWSRGRPITGSIAERYLRTARGYCGALPPTLAFLPPTKPEYRPALIAAFGLCDEPEPGALAAPRIVDAVHLTLLKADGSGKADVKHDKLTIGRPRGRPIVLAPPNDLLGHAVTEGIEDGLSIHQATGLGVWAAGCAPFMPKLASMVPGYVEVITIIVDADPAGQRYAGALARTLSQRPGISVEKITFREVSHADDEVV